MDSYDPKFNVKLKTYAEHRIRGAILDSIRGLDGIPVHKRKRLKDVEAAIASAEQRLQRVPGEEEIAGEMNIPLAEYQELLAELRGVSLGSLDEIADGFRKANCSATSRTTRRIFLRASWSALNWKSCWRRR